MEPEGQPECFRFDRRVLRIVDRRICMLWLCRVIAALSIATAATASAAQVDILPGNAARSASPAPHYAQYDARKAVYQPPAQHPQSAPLGPPKVFLLRGLMNVFSLGMDDLAERIKADGIPATVTNHADADMLV